MKKKILAIVLALAMCLTLLPTMALAANYNVTATNYETFLTDGANPDVWAVLTTDGHVFDFDIFVDPVTKALESGKTYVLTDMDSDFTYCDDGDYFATAASFTWTNDGGNESVVASMTLDNGDTYNITWGSSPSPQPSGDISDIAGVLATKPDFPVTEETGWTTESGNPVYFDDEWNSISFKGVELTVNIPVTVSGDNYVYLDDPDNNYRITFVMTAGVLSSIVFEDLSEDDSYALYVGTYLPRTAEPAVDYALYLTVEDSEGVVYKATYAESSWTKVESIEPDGLTYNDGEWTMTDFSFRTTAQTAVYIDGNAVLNIVGTNTIDNVCEDPSLSFVQGMEASADLTIQGTGSLTVTSPDTTQYSYGIGVDHDLAVNSGSVTATAGDGDNGSYGIYVDNGLTVKGELTAIAGASDNGNSFGIFVSNNDMVVDGGTVTATGGNLSNCSYCSFGIYAGNDLAVNSGSVTATGRDGDNGSYGIYVYYGLTVKGKLKATAGDADNGKSYGIYVYKADMVVDGGTVTATGGDGYNGSYGIYVYYGLTVKGELTAIAGDADNGDSYGIYAYYGMKVSDGIVEATGGEADDYSYGIYSYNSSIEVSGGSVTATGREANHYSIGIYGYYSSIEVSGGSVTATGGEAGDFSGGIYIYYSSMKVSGGIVEATGGEADDYSYGLYTGRCNLTVTGGKIIANGETAKVGPYITYYFKDEDTDSGYAEAETSKYMSYSNVMTDKGCENLNFLVPMDVHGIYNEQDLQTTYKSQGYIVVTEGLENAEVTSDADLAYGDHFAMLKYTVTAQEDITDGKLGIWADVMIGDNDYAPVSVIKDEDTDTVVGFELKDDHTNGCSNPNAKYMCYFGGSYLDEEIGETYQPADTYWFGYYYYAQDHVFDKLNKDTANDYNGNINYKADYTELEDTDSGMAVSWKVNLAAGESMTYYVLLGIGDQTFSDPPAFGDGDEAPVIEDGKVSTKVYNEVQDVSTGGDISLSVITDGGDEFTVGDEPLEGETSPMCATFTKVPINTRPGTYTIKKVRATNEGGLPVTYTFPTGDEPTTTVELEPVESALVIDSTTEPLRYQGWDLKRDDTSTELDLFGLDLTAPEGAEAGLVLPEGTTVVVEEEGANINAPGEGASAIEADGDLKISTNSSNGKPLSLNAPVGIEVDGELTVAGPVSINASEIGIDCDELTIENGGSLEIKVEEGGKVFNDGMKMNIPSNYEIIGGKIDEDGFFIADEGATEIIIREKAPVADDTVTVPVSGDENKINAAATISGKTAELEPVSEKKLDKVIGDEVETGMVTLDLSKLGQDITGVKLPTELLEAIAEAAVEAENDTAGLEIDFTSGKLEFDADALETIAEAADGAPRIEIHFDDVGTKRLNNEQKAAVSEMDVIKGFEAYITVNGERVSDFGGGKVVVYIPYVIPEGRTPAGYTVWFVAEDGTLEKMDSTYDGENQRFVVTHFSDYILTYDENAAPSGVCPKDETCVIEKFTDTANDEWWHDGIHYCVENGLMKGVADDLFDPEGDTSRAMIVTILWRLEGEPTADVEDFSDVPADEWYTEAVRWASSEDIVLGYDAEHFGPDDPITREQLATILYRYAQYKGQGFTGDWMFPLDFVDTADIDEWANEAIHWCSMKGIVNGKEGKVFDPLGNATRAEAATMMQRFCETLEK